MIKKVINGELKEIKAIKRYIPNVGLVNIRKVLKDGDKQVFHNDNLFELRKFVAYDANYSMSNGILAVSKGNYSDNYIYSETILKGGHTYKISLYAKCNVVPSRTLWINRADESGTDFPVWDWNVKTAGEWFYIEKEVTLNVDYKIRLYAPFGTNEETQYYKDIVIKELN